MTCENYKLEKIISLLIISSIFLPAIFIFSAPQKANAQWIVSDPILEAAVPPGTASTITDTGISIKNVAKDVLREIVKNISRRALAQMTKSTVNWINNGFHGAPLFLENPESFFRDITKFEIKDLVNTVGYDPNRFPFGKQFALDTIASYKRQLSDNAEYSLSKVIDDPQLLIEYRTDFNVGGWNGFLLHTQYPQNNYIGSRILLNDELARRLEGTTQNAAEKVNTTLQQGLGFLSPKTCPSNPNYKGNDTFNEFNRPSFKSTIPYNPPVPDNTDSVDVINSKLDSYNYIYQNQVDTEKLQWEAENTCPGGLVSTTPGYVVASQITKALGVSQDQASLGAALGNSLSAVFDALLNKFLSSGLNALASTVNTQPNYTDNWDYDGETLGSPATNNPYGGDDWANGPDEEIVLAKFKEDVTKGIVNTEIELALIDNATPGSYGITQYLSLIWPKTRELDICLPGPDLGWEQRLIEEVQRTGRKLENATNSSNANRAYAASLALKELNFAVDFFKDWIQTKMMTSLPSGIIFIDAVKELETLDQESLELTDKKRARAQALARLKAIEANLASIINQPAPGSQAEKDLITIKRQYNAILYSISNGTTIEDTRAELDMAKDKFFNLQSLANKCTTERTTAGWTIPTTLWQNPVGDISILTTAVGQTYDAPGKDRFGRDVTVSQTTTGTEKEQFCQLPIVSGYTHETFINWWQNSPLYPNLPLVNGKKVYRNVTNVSISCNIIYRSYALDYKGNLPGVNNLVEPPPEEREAEDEEPEEDEG